jgi:hypothetical protein
MASGIVLQLAGLPPLETGGVEGVTWPSSVSPFFSEKKWKLLL